MDVARQGVRPRPPGSVCEMFRVPEPCVHQAAQPSHRDLGWDWAREPVSLPRSERKKCEM